MSDMTMPWWANCITGAIKFLSGERRSMPDQIECLSKCAECPSMMAFHEDELHNMCGILVRWFMPNHKPITCWCGEPGVATDKTCGCLVGTEPGRGRTAYSTITVSGREVGLAPAGKLTVESERCPQGKF
jgi:hypothetical protein